VLGLAATVSVTDTEALQELANTPMDRKGFAAFAASLLTGIDDSREALEKVASAEGRSLAQLTRKGDALTELFVSGKGNRGADRYDALNAATEYVDWFHNKPQGWRQLDDGAVSKGMDSALFGNGERMKQRAAALLMRD